MLTGHAETERVPMSRDAGINHFLTKPASVKALSDRIVSLIDHPRPFIRTQRYFGPDRRRKNLGPPERKVWTNGGSSIRTRTFSIAEF